MFLPRSQLSSALKQLHAMKAEVDNHEPAHLFPSDIQRQIENLAVSIVFVQGQV